MNYDNAIFDVENVPEAYKNTNAQIAARVSIILEARPTSADDLIDRSITQAREALEDLPEVMRAIATRLRRISERPEEVTRLLELADAVESDGASPFRISELAELAASLSENTPRRVVSLLTDLRANVRVAVHLHQRAEYLRRRRVTSA